MKKLTFDQSITTVAVPGQGDNVSLRVEQVRFMDGKSGRPKIADDYERRWPAAENRAYIRGIMDEFDPSQLMPDSTIEAPDFTELRSLNIDNFGSINLNLQSNSYRGIIPIGFRENLIPGSDLATAVVGTPGTMPGFFSGINVSFTVDAIGTQQGMNYVDVTATAGTAAQTYIFPCGANTIHKNLAQPDPTGGSFHACGFSWYLAMLPGSVNVGTTPLTMMLNNHPAGSFNNTAWTTGIIQRNIVPPWDGVLRPYYLTGSISTEQVTNPYLLPGLRINKLTSGVASTLKLRMGWPVLETSGWYPTCRRSPFSIIPLTAKSDTVFKASRLIRPNLPLTPQGSGSVRKSLSLVLDISPISILMDNVTTRATLMPVLLFYRSGGFSSGINHLTFGLFFDPAVAPLCYPFMYSLATDEVFAVSPPTYIFPGGRLKMALSIERTTVRWSFNGGAVGLKSDGTNQGITQYNIDDILFGGTDYLLRDFKFFYRVLSDAELQALSR